MKRIAQFVLGTFCFIIMTVTAVFADIAAREPGKYSPSSLPIIVYALGVVIAIIIAVLIIRFVRKRKTK